MYTKVNIILNKKLKPTENLIVCYIKLEFLKAYQPKITWNQNEYLRKNLKIPRYALQKYHSKFRLFFEILRYFLFKKRDINTNRLLFIFLSASDWKIYLKLIQINTSFA